MYIRESEVGSYLAMFPVDEIKRGDERLEKNGSEEANRQPAMLGLYEMRA